MIFDLNHQRFSKKGIELLPLRSMDYEGSVLQLFSIGANDIRSHKVHEGNGIGTGYVGAVGEPFNGVSHDIIGSQCRASCFHIESFPEDVDCNLFHNSYLLGDEV